ncbi:haloacid dehalogenase-like hydrolase [Providencia alcalifaciens]
MKKILLLDICGTITEKNTTIDFIKSLGHDLPPYKKIFGRVLWRVFKIDYLRREYIKKLFGYENEYLKIKSQEYINNLYYDEVVIKYVYYLKNNGFDIYLISASLDIITSSISNKFGFNCLISSELDFNENLCSGKLKSDALDKKESMISDDIFESRNITCIISDNFGDYQLMKMCTYPFAISRNNNAERYWKDKNIYIIKR